LLGIQLFIKLNKVPADLHPIGRNCATNQQGVNGFLPVGVSHFVGKEKKNKKQKRKNKNKTKAFVPSP
jgi:hypothetical protein